MITILAHKPELNVQWHLVKQRWSDCLQMPHRQCTPKPSMNMPWSNEPSRRPFVFFSLPVMNS